MGGQQAQAAATGTQATRKAATSSIIRSKSTNNNPETVRAVRRRGVPRRGPEGWGPKISRFFLPLPPLFSFFLPFLGVVSWNFGGVIEGRDPQMCTFGLSGCRVKPRRPGGGGLAEGGPAEGVESGRGPAEGSGERPNFGRTHENFEHTPHRHTTTQHNTTTPHRWIPHRSWPKKQDMSNKLSRRAAPWAKVFGGQGWFAQVWAQNGLIRKGAKKRSGPKVVWTKSGAGQMWSKIQQKNLEKTNQKINPSPILPKQKMKNQKKKTRKNIPKLKKMENISPPRPKIKKIKKINNKVKKLKKF